LVTGLSAWDGIFPRGRQHVPPSPGLGAFLDGGGWSSAELLAGRPFHWVYESLLLKSLVFLDLPGTVAMIPVSLALASVAKVCGLGFYAMSYVTATLMLIGGTSQWLLVGRWCDRHLERRSPSVRGRVHRWAGLCIAVIIAATAVLAPTINQHSRVSGLKHGGSLSDNDCETGFSSIGRSGGC
jgi:hypothetical protein